MHGRPRRPAKPEEDAASIEKAAKLRSLQSQLLHNHQNKIYTKEALEISSKLLELNPEFYTAWNYRKLAVQYILLSETDTGSIKSILNEELIVVENALRRNFKSYGAWHHRKWVLSKGYSSVDDEFRLLDKFQKADPRNFHAWNYRRFVAELKNVPAEVELKYTTNMIDRNFSNYSAWHNRSVILSHLMKQKAEGFDLKNKVLTEEYELVHQALFTDPDDQSGWFYHLWLLDQTVTPDAPVLMSSWPVHGSDLVVSLDRNMTDDLFAPFTSYRSNDGTFPLILYFNQAVEGVNSSTVTIRYMVCKNEDLIWKPLTVSPSGKAQAWMTYLKFPDLNINSFETYPVEVSLGNTQGIISSTGSSYSIPSQFIFTVRLQPVDAKQSDRDTCIEMVSWTDESFLRNAVLQNFSPCVLNFDNLTISINEPAALNWQIETITNEIALFRELLLEIPCKIGKLTLARLLMAHDAIMLYNSPSVYKKVNSEEVLELFDDLMKLDPSHLRYYKDERSVVLMEQVVSNRKALEKHCCYYGESTNLLVRNTVCLRLNNLSLSRLGSLEHLLWVQMLDLRHNELKSIAGLEKLQLLTCLNLSHNKFSSFTAFKPLRMLNSLKVLDISYNEIGSHLIDTTRYLCSSPLCHTVGDDHNVDEYVTDDVEVTDYWEAVLIFKGMKLTQLDIVGNAVSDEKFSFLLRKVLPRLRWLDGKAVR